MEFSKNVRMGKLLLMVITVVFTVGNLQAQSFSEWFKQKKTQKKYLLAQIAALETYLKAVEKGYDIARDGITVVSGLKEGDFMQHMLHFQHLQMVSPVIKNYSKVVAIAEMEDRSEKFRSAVYSEGDLERFLTGRELATLRRAFDNAGAESRKDLEELEMLVSDGKLKMTDDERITHIDRLYVEVKAKLQSVLGLGNSIQALVAARQKRKSDMGILKKLYGN